LVDAVEQRIYRAFLRLYASVLESPSSFHWLLGFCRSVWRVLRSAIWMKRSGPNDQVVTAHAIQLGDRINTSGIEGETLSTSPLAIRIDKEGIAVLFRYGVVVPIGLSQQQEQKLLEKLSTRVSGRLDRFEEETAVIKLADEDEDQVPAGGPILVRAMSPERLLVISDVLAKSVVLAHDERRVAEVFEVIEPFARELATRGKARLNRTGILRLIGNALLVQHRVSGRVAIAEKPDALWDRPDLERLYARLEDEYELQERVDALNRKLAVISETATTLADIIDTQRSLRLELIIVALIALEIVITFYQILASRAGH
jgi:required for meiotic nuclear division protein 1